MQESPPDDRAGDRLQSRRRPIRVRPNATPHGDLHARDPEGSVEAVVYRIVLGVRTGGAVGRTSVGPPHRFRAYPAFAEGGVDLGDVRRGGGEDFW